MKECPSCDKKISHRAEICPSCGHPVGKDRKRNNDIFTMIMLLVGLIVFLVLSKLGGIDYIVDHLLGAG